ncbi:MAG: hypothetical protein IJ279_03770 [Clostridia bacterium]|nr:hypothetical protein [Clostridia bacterium]
MKAKDSVKNYDSKIREYTNYSYRQAKNACKNYGPRPAGSDKEKELQEHLMNELRGCTNAVTSENFNFIKSTAFSENIFTLILIVIATAITILCCLNMTGGNDTIFAMVVAVLVLFGGINIFTGFTNKMFAKKASSANIHAVRKADEKAEKRLILIANSDSLEKRKFNTSVFAVISAIGFVFNLIVVFLDSYLKLFANFPSLKYASFALVIFIPFAIIPLFADSDEYSEGASKNLSGAFASIAVLKYLKDNEIRMPSLEICVVITSAHTNDTAGARAFANRHASYYSDIPTTCICIDSIAFDEKNLGIIKAKNSQTSYDFLKAGAADAAVEIIDSPLQGKYSPDSTFISTMGIDACAITSLPLNYAKQPDTFEDMKVKTIESALKTVVSGAFLFEEK